MVRQKCLDLLDLIAEGKTKQRPPTFEVPERELPCRFNVQPTTWFARDNVFNFILFCRRLGKFFIFSSLVLFFFSCLFVCSFVVAHFICKIVKYLCKLGCGNLFFSKSKWISKCSFPIQKMGQNQKISVFFMSMIKSK